jgi:GNAT superfamily N-acetyltransferase
MNNAPCCFEVKKMEIRNMTAADRDAVIAMMRTFYASDAVWSNGSEEIFRADVEACISGSPYLEGYVLVEAGGTVGYSMLAKSFSVEFGRPCVWIEDLFLTETARGRGFGTAFLQFVADQYPDAVLRLEAEEENRRAVEIYRKNGFEVLPYMEMIKR